MDVCEMRMVFDNARRGFCGKQAADFANTLQYAFSGPEDLKAEIFCDTLENKGIDIEEMIIPSKKAYIYFD